MRLHTITCMAAIAAALALANPAAASPEKLTWGIDAMVSSGESDWTVSFVDDFGAGSSTLTWDDLQTVMVIGHASFQFTPLLSLGAELGLGQIVDGSNTDEDFTDGIKDEESTADTEGSVSRFALEGRLNIGRMMNLDDGAELELLLAWFQHKENYEDSNGVQTLSEGESMNEPFDGLDSTFDFTWSGIRAGAAGTLPLGSRLKLKASAALLLAVSYEGEGFWNLRDEFSAESPNFVQEADGGSGFETRVSLCMAIKPNLQIEGGIWYTTVSVEDGTDVIYFADGTTGDSVLDEAETTRMGGFIGLVGTL